MTYNIKIRNGHHYVDMAPKQENIVDMKPKQETLAEAIGRGVADFLDGFHNEMERLAKSMQEGLDRLSKHPEPTEHIEPGVKRVSKEKQKPVRVHPGRNEK